MGPIVVQTQRLFLREWTAEDAASDADDFMALVTDPEVMRYISGGEARPRADVLDFIARQLQTQRERGWSRWALQLREPAKGEPVGVVGFCGPGCTFAPDVEVGWRLHRDVWGRGLATEAGRAAVEYCFRTIGFSRLVCCVHPENARSLAVARKVGFRPFDEFEHEGVRLIRHEMLNPLPEPPRDARFARGCG